MKKTCVRKIEPLTALSDSETVHHTIGDSPVAVQNHQHKVVYLTPKAPVDRGSFEYADHDSVLRTLEQSRDEMQPIMDYLQDK